MKTYTVTVSDNASIIGQETYNTWSSAYDAYANEVNDRNMGNEAEWTGTYDMDLQAKKGTCVITLIVHE